MENFTETKIKSIAEENSKVFPEPKLKLWDKLYDKFGTEHRVVYMALHVDIKYSPEWSYAVIPTSDIEILSKGYLWYDEDFLIYDDDIDVRYFTTRPSVSQRMKSLKQVM